MTSDTRRTLEGSGATARGQTLHDYVAGITVFVLTLAVVLGLLPSVIGPFQAEASTADATEATRIADRVVENYSLGGTPNTLNATAIDEFFNTSEATLQTRYGLASHQHVNVSLRSTNGSTVLTNASGTLLWTGATAASEDASSSARIVTLDNESYALLNSQPNACSPACRLVVRVW